MSRVRTGMAIAAVAAAIASPPLGSAFTGTMTTHMGLQIPLLVLCGWWLGGLVGTSAGHRLRDLAAFRWAAFVVAAATLSVWMIPRLLDLAVESASTDGVKAVSLVLLAGVPLRLAWEQFGPVERGVVHVEALASFWRLGWLYLDSPSRLCTQYGMDDQQRLGSLLLRAGFLYAAWLAWRALMPEPAREGTS